MENVLGGAPHPKILAYIPLSQYNKRKSIKTWNILNKENCFTKFKIEDDSQVFFQEKWKHFVFNFNNNSKLMYTVQQQNLW